MSNMKPAVTILPPKPTVAIAEPPPLLPDGVNCKVIEDEEAGDAVVVFRIQDAVTFNRLKRRAGTQDLATHLWENLLKRTVTSYVY